MAVVFNSVVIPKSPAICLSSGSLKSADQSVGPTNLAFNLKGTRRSSAQRKALTIRASYRDVGRPSAASNFVGGFVLGGLIVATLGCVYAPQLSEALPERKELMSKLPKFIYDEEKALEKHRKKLTEKLEHLNSALDDIYAQLIALRNREVATEVSSESDDVEAFI